MDLSSVHVGIHRRRRRKRVGRGIGSGHGMPKGTFEGGQMPLFRRLPKRGFSHATWDRYYHVVNVGDLNRFDDGATVDAAVLREVGLAKGPADGVRILGTGDLTKRLVVRAHHFSKSALEKITARGGTAERIPPPKKPVRNKMKPRPPKEG